MTPSLRTAFVAAKQSPMMTMSTSLVGDCFAFGFDTGEKSTRPTQPPMAFSISSA